MYHVYFLTIEEVTEIHVWVGRLLWFKCTRTYMYIYMYGKCIKTFA